jgi:hypothetical protein
MSTPNERVGITTLLMKVVMTPDSQTVFASVAEAISPMEGGLEPNAT